MILQNHYAIACLMRDFCSRPPKAVPVKVIWGMDLTSVPLADGSLQQVLGIIDHGSRVAVTLARLANKSSWTLLGTLCFAIGKLDKPKAIKTDNEAVFTSRVFRWGLIMLGIRHLRSQVACPWQNGRIERFFGTLKFTLRQLALPTIAAIDLGLSEFQWFYNHVRPHQNLNGRTPVEAWSRVDPRQRPAKDILLVHALGGALTGYYLRR